MKLAKRVALITGGSEGIGYATARLFLQEGALVVITGRSKRKGDRAIKALKDLGDVIFLKGDASRSNDARGIVKATIERYGHIDILFNNAGVYIEKLAEDTTEREWDRVIDTNLKGVFLMVKYAVPYMKRDGGGVIVNNSSDAGLVGNRNCPAYCASKGGVTIMTKAMALDYAPYNIRVNSVNPGTIDTPMLAYEAKASGDSEEYLKQMDEEHPMGRVGRAEEVARAVLFLVSDDSSFVTGAALSVDGGLTAQ
ncbi:MAG: glucose 1-dehydrogenase [Thermoplasmata archaeon]|nr:glucose 1-dehydrogenase [Thermoplasmata archaeon]